MIMFLNFEEYNIYLKHGATDMRKSSASLSVIVEREMELCAFNKSIFVFCSKNKRVFKAILWDEN